MKLNWGSRSCIIYLQMSWRATEASIKWWRSGSIFLEFLQDHQGNWNHPTKFKRVLGFIDSLISPHRVTHSRTLGARGFSCPVSESLSRGFAARVFGVLAAAADEAPRRTREKTSSTQGTTAETEPIGFSNVHSFCFIITMFDGSISKDFTRKSTKNVLELTTGMAGENKHPETYFLPAFGFNQCPFLQ